MATINGYYTSVEIQNYSSTRKNKEYDGYYIDRFIYTTGTRTCISNDGYHIITTSSMSGSRFNKVDDGYYIDRFIYSTGTRTCKSDDGYLLNKLDYTAGTRTCKSDDGYYTYMNPINYCPRMNRPDYCHYISQEPSSSGPRMNMPKEAENITFNFRSRAFRMRGRDSGAPSVVYLYWTVSGIPSKTYPDTEPAPPYGGPVVDIIIIDEWAI